MKWLDGWLDERVNGGCIDEWVDERVDGWINGVPPACSVPPLDETEGWAGGLRLCLGRGLVPAGRPAVRCADSPTRGLSALPGASRPWSVRLAPQGGVECHSVLVPPPDLSQPGPRLWWRRCGWAERAGSRPGRSGAGPGCLGARPGGRSSRRSACTI